MRWSFFCSFCFSFVQGALSFQLADHAKAFATALQQAESLSRDCAALDRGHVDSGRDPLVAASDPRPVFRQYLLALRHLMAFVAQRSSQSGAVPEHFLGHAGELDLELSQLTFLGKLEPYYFWHGPKRHVPAKLEELLHVEIDGQEIRQLLASTPQQELVQHIPTPTMTLPNLGLAYPTAARPVDVLSSSAVRMSGAGDACAVSAAAVKAGIRYFISSGHDAKMNLKSCLDAGLQVVWDMADAFADVLATESQTPVQDAVGEALASLRRGSLDVLGLPPRAWTDRRLKGYVAQVLGSFLSKAKVKAIALVGTLSSKQLQKVLGSSLAPSMWLAPHDDCASISPSALEIADKKKVQVIGFGAPCGSILEHVAQREAMGATSLLGRWTAELGLLVALPHTTPDLAAVLKKVQAAPPLSSESWRLLSGSAALSRTAGLVIARDFEDSLGLRDIVERATNTATGELQSIGVPAVTGSLNKRVWKSLEQDKAEFDDNHFIIYKADFLSPEKYNQVKSEAARLWLSSDLEPNCNLDGVDRTGGYVLDTALLNSSLYRLFYGDEEFRRWVSRINGHQMFPSDFPVELREYPSGSSGMGCHRDLLMYTNATLDLEFVYTIDNLGTCISTFENRRGETTEVHTEANSLIMVRPNAAMHCVKPAEGGHRTILKFIYVGDYRKSSEFGFYTTNSCPQDNPNVRAVLARREVHESTEL